MEITGERTQLLLRMLDAASLRARTVASNVANANTPGYLRREVRFEDLLRRAVERGDRALEVAPEVRIDRESPARTDGNNVSLEREMSDLRESRMLYETYAAVLAGHFEMLRASIQER